MYARWAVPAWGGRNVTILPDFFLPVVAQSERAPDCESGGRTFESFPRCQFGGNAIVFAGVGLKPYPAGNWSPPPGVVVSMFHVKRG